MPWSAPWNRPLTGPVVLAMVPSRTSLLVRPTSVPEVGQLLAEPPVVVDPPPVVVVPPPVVVPVPPVVVPVPPARPPPPLRTASAACLRSCGSSRAPHAARARPNSTARATTRILRVTKVDVMRRRLEAQGTSLAVLDKAAYSLA